MKTTLVATLFCLGTVSHANSIPDLQDRMAAEVIKDGMILVRNDTTVPYEVKTWDIGKYLMCLSLDYKTSGLIPITKSMFPKSESTVLVRCRDGKFYFSRGYV